MHDAGAAGREEGELQESEPDGAEDWRGYRV